MTITSLNLIRLLGGCFAYYYQEILYDLYTCRLLRIDEPRDFRNKL